ncbi:hypothetical protein SHO565_16410 [Streptomyces sp. HO565]
MCGSDFEEVSGEVVGPFHSPSAKRGDGGVSFALEAAAGVAAAELLGRWARTAYPPVRTMRLRT